MANKRKVLAFTSLVCVVVVVVLGAWETYARREPVQEHSYAVDVDVNEAGVVVGGIEGARAAPRPLASPRASIQSRRQEQQPLRTPSAGGMVALGEPTSEEQAVFSAAWGTIAQYEPVTGRSATREGSACAAWTPSPGAAPLAMLTSLHKTATTTWSAMAVDGGRRVAGALSRTAAPADRSAGSLHARACDLLQAASAKNVTALQDVPWFLFYDLVYDLFPGSRFVHIDRPEDEWLDSAVRHFTTHPGTPWRAFIYGAECNTAAHVGVSDQCRARMLNVFRQHNAAVKRFFAPGSGRSDAFLVLDIHNLTESVARRHADFLGHVGPSAWPELNVDLDHKAATGFTP